MNCCVEREMEQHCKVEDCVSAGENNQEDDASFEETAPGEDDDRDHKGLVTMGKGKRVNIVADFVTAKEQMEEDKERLVSLREDMDVGPITDLVDRGFSESLECGYCCCYLDLDSFPLRVGGCGHTLCDSCYCSFVKKDGEEPVNPACPTCKNPDSFEREQCNNELAMKAVDMVSKLQRFGRSSLMRMHSRWKHHVGILEKQHPPDSKLKEHLVELKAELEARDRAIDGIRSAHKQQLKTMRKKLVVSADNLVVAREEILAMDQILRHQEGGRKIYYLLCPVCKDHMETMRGKPILWIPEKFTSESVREGLTVCDQEKIADEKVVAQLWEQEGFRKMRKHILCCVGVEKGRKARDKDLPPFYRKNSIKDCAEEPTKKRRVSYD